jgi:hypothetical protein
VDNAVLTFLITQAIAPAAFTTREVIVVRLSPELASGSGVDEVVSVSVFFKLGDRFAKPHQCRPPAISKSATDP